MFPDLEITRLYVPGDRVPRLPPLAGMPKDVLAEVATLVYTAVKPDSPVAFVAVMEIGGAGIVTSQIAEAVYPPTV